MPHNFVIAILLFLSYPSFGQKNPDLVFTGSVEVDGGADYTYSLHLADSGMKITGYSVTDIAGPNETKATIAGIVDAGKRQIEYREKKIIFTKTKGAESDFCYVSAHLKISEDKGTTVLKGHFTGYKEDDHTVCAAGKILLVCLQGVSGKLLETRNNDSIQYALHKPPETATRYVYEKDVPESSISKLKAGDSIQLMCASPVITIDVWDAGAIDGDVITLLQDDKPLLKNYTLTGTHKQVALNLGNAKTSTVTLIAVTEGSEPLNTARVKVTSGNAIYYIDANNTIGKKIIFTLRRK